ncbi:MAG: hypothetical protein AB7K71_40790 [Polyangiaceae bacterium]
MRTGIALLALLLVALSAANEWLWRAEFTAIESVPAPSGSLIAEVRNLPEGSTLPYGQGVFLRHSMAVSHKYQSQLAFAGYCLTLNATWASDRLLRIECVLQEHEPIIVAKHALGAEVEVAVDRSRIRPAAATERKP